MLDTVAEPVTAVDSIDLPAPDVHARLRGTVARFAFPLALVALLSFGVLGYSQFRTVDNLRNILIFSSVLFVVSIGQTLVVLTRGVDLSVGSMVGLSGAVYAHLYTTGTTQVVAILAALGLGLGVGYLFHGLLITKLKISFLIVTLGTFSILASQMLVVLKGNAVVVDSALLAGLANDRVLGIPDLVLFAAALYVIALLMLRATALGRAIYAVGSNPTAARLTGIPVDRVLMTAFGLCSLFAAVAGLLTVGQLGSAEPSAGVGLELQSIAAVLIGGTRFSGGYGGVTNTLFGVLFLGVLNNLLLTVGVSSFWQPTFAGLVLIAAVGIDRTRKE
jgi:ribose/xylose/arabinose/galactoside ABC-type transport system permease subunit